ncbi:MAG: trehalose 6-phosphate synthase [Desulfobacteraceae bacterium]|nr:trehalose 6-phosphate synthase [Desulfobacteraceae bacterium]MBC2720809.1 trehalose 6-phosphate synthase [Desulfobacteraceae bacterium]
MSPTFIKKQEIHTLKQFYNQMAMTRAVRYKLVENIFTCLSIDCDLIKSLKNALFSLEEISSEDGLKLLYIDDSKKISARLIYEISELKKDIFFLENTEKKFIEHLEKLHDGFINQVNKGIEKLQGLKFNCFITDRDGTINNYCGRYCSSVQSVYNSVFLTRFARKKAINSIIITSAPLSGPGILDVCVNPDKTFIYAASKGRECIDLSGERKIYRIEEKKQRLLNNLNKRLLNLVKKPVFEKFSMIGSGLQFKFGQTTIARQNIRKSIPESESKEFLEKIGQIVQEIDPGQENFRIEDTGLDIEIILTIEDSLSGAKDFDKADAVRYLDDALKLNMKQGPHLICGDTSSDVLLIEAAMEKTPDTWTVFVTKDRELAARVKAICSNSFIVTEPDILVTILGLL